MIAPQQEKILNGTIPTSPTKEAAKKCLNPGEAFVALSSVKYLAVSSPMYSIGTFVVRLSSLLYY